MRTRLFLSASLLPCLLFLAPGCKPKGESNQAPQPTAQQPATPKPACSHDASGPIGEAALGLKLYPGARMVTSGETDEVVSANLETSDAPEKVQKFYQQELGLPTDAPPEMTLSGKKNGRMFAVSVVRSEGVTSVSIMGKK